MRLLSSAIQEGRPIPPRFTCEGANISPEFYWVEARKETKSFVLILHDRDAPRDKPWHFVPMKPGSSDTLGRVEIVVISILAMLVLGLLAVAFVQRRYGRQAPTRWSVSNRCEILLPSPPTTLPLPGC